jgi:hypothetical protein
VYVAPGLRIVQQLPEAAHDTPPGLIGPEHDGGGHDAGEGEDEQGPEDPERETLRGLHCSASFARQTQPQAQR